MSGHVIGEWVGSDGMDKIQGFAVCVWVGMEGEEQNEGE